MHLMSKTVNDTVRFYFLKLICVRLSGLDIKTCLIYFRFPQRYEVIKYCTLILDLLCEIRYRFTYLQYSLYRMLYDLVYICTNFAGFKSKPVTPQDMADPLNNFTVKG
jgi:hypothetical protein